MATLASAPSASFVQQRQISVETTTAPSLLGISVSTAVADSALTLTSSSKTSSTSSALSSCSSSTSSSCESGIILSGSLHCSPLTNLSTSTSSSSTANVVTVKTSSIPSPSSSSSSFTTCLNPASLLPTDVSTALTPRESESSSIPLSSSISFSSSTTTPSTTAKSPKTISCKPVHTAAKYTLNENAVNVAPYTSAHQLLLNGLTVSDADLNGAVNATSLVEDSRTLQLALELSMVGLNDTLQLQVQQQQLQLQQLQQQHLQQMQQQFSHQHQQQPQNQQQSSFDMSTLSAAVAAAAAVATATNNQSPPTHSITVSHLNQFSSGLLSGIEDRSKKSQNMTECVPVPSSEHVAEIVGRQGCKIKALRAKTNTYIKTPVRGEEPVFVVTGRKEDVAKAKREILSAAEHFSVIRASRKPSLAGSLNGSLNGTGSSAKTPPGPPSIPGQVTIQVRVPYRVVGLVVGPKGATIKHIQQETQTYIVTPSREKEPIFEVTGLPDNVQAARKQIEAHIALRTGNLTAPANDAGTTNSKCGLVHTINSLSQILSDDVSPEFLASIYKNGLCSTFDYADGCINSANAVSTLPVSANNIAMSLNSTSCGTSHSLINDMTSMSTANNFQIPSNNISNDFLNNMLSRRGAIADGLDAHQSFDSGSNLNNNNIGNIVNGNGINSSVMGISISGNDIHNGVANPMGMSRSCSSASSTTSSKSANNSGGSSSSRPELSNIWKNLGDSLDVDEGIGESPSIWTLPSSLATFSSHYSPTTSISPTDSLLGESNSLGQLLATQTQQRLTVSLNNSSTQEHRILNHNHQNLVVHRECLKCGDNEVTATLVPCGHNMFCMDCANRICSSSESVCPLCSRSVFHAVRILP